MKHPSFACLRLRSWRRRRPKIEHFGSVLYHADGRRGGAHLPGRVGATRDQTLSPSAPAPCVASEWNSPILRASSV